MAFVSHNTFTITPPLDNAGAYSFNMPQWGYVVTINMAMAVVKLENRKYKSYDHGASFDYRTFRAELLYPEKDSTSVFQASKMREMLKSYPHAPSTSPTYSASGYSQWELPTGSGFFIFGPDKGDVGTWPVRIVDLDTGFTSGSPLNYFFMSVEGVLDNYATALSPPSYTLPTEVDEGNVTIGSVSGLRHPETWWRATTDLNYTSTTTLGGAVFSRFLQEQSEEGHDTSITLVCNPSKAAALVDHLTQTVRSSVFTMSVPSESYPFGPNKSSGGGSTFTCRLVSPVITVVHRSVKQFEIGLTISLESIA